jgi:hypothetical protein
MSIFNRLGVHILIGVLSLFLFFISSLYKVKNENAFFFVDKVFADVPVSDPVGGIPPNEGGGNSGGGDGSSSGGDGCCSY